MTVRVLFNRFKKLFKFIPVISRKLNLGLYTQIFTSSSLHNTSCLFIYLLLPHVSATIFGQLQGTTNFTDTSHTLYVVICELQKCIFLMVRMVKW
jgi:hypothetical protein